MDACRRCIGKPANGRRGSRGRKCWTCRQPGMPAEVCQARRCNRLPDCACMLRARGRLTGLPCVAEWAPEPPELLATSSHPDVPFETLRQVHQASGASWLLLLPIF